jgi:hypothetical protein
VTAIPDNESAKKKPYVKPEVKSVTLRPEEAVLAACKTGAISGPGQLTCALPAPCSSLAS